MSQTRLAYPLDREQSSRLLAEPDTSATALHMILLGAYGPELYGEEGEPQMDPVELWVRVREDFSVTVPEENENRINALMLAVSTDNFYSDPVTFSAVCLGIHDGDLADMVAGVMEELTLPEMLWGIFEVALNRDDDMEFQAPVWRIIERETRESVEEEAGEFSYFERGLISGKTQIIRELRLLKAPDEVINQVRVFDETPVHDEEGNLEGR